MWEVEATSITRAMKDYPCQAWEYVDNMDAEFDQEDVEAITKARDEDFKIVKGSQYLKVRGKWEGEWQTFRARLDMDKICQKHDLYAE